MHQTDPGNFTTYVVAYFFLACMMVNFLYKGKLHAVFTVSLLVNLLVLLFWKKSDLSKHFSECLRREMNDRGIVGRYGGDAFLVLLENMNLEESHLLQQIHSIDYKGISPFPQTAALPF